LEAFGHRIAAPLARCAELLGVDLATICEAAANVEPYLAPTAPGPGASCSLSGSFGPRPTVDGEAATSTADEPPTPMYRQAERRQTQPPSSLFVNNTPE
jgi:hypothetical protein